MTHPRDVWVEVTSMGEAVPRFLLAVDGRELEIEEAKSLYVHDRIDIEELERRIEDALAQ